MTALNIRLKEVELTQAVSTRIGPDASGGAIAVSMRNARALEKRPTLVRAHYEVGAGWESRTIEAVLYLQGANGAARAAHSDQDRFGKLRRSQAHQHLQLGALGDAGDGRPWRARRTARSGGFSCERRCARLTSFSAEGDADLGLQAGRMDVKVTLIPVTVGGQTVSVSPADVKAFVDYTQNIYPLQTLEIAVHAPHALPGTIYGQTRGPSVHAVCAAQDDR